MPPPPAQAQAPALPDELIDDIFLRLPKDEPESLVRASLANKHWLSLLTGPRFRGRYRDFHGSPPMLGFLYCWPPDYTPKERDNVPHFVATTKFGARIPDDQDWEDAVSEYSAWDCRHGRVLFSHTDVVPMLLTVWNPMTGCRTEMRAPADYHHSQRAAVVCTVSGCDHRSCHDGPFRVVFIGLGYDDGDSSLVFPFKKFYITSLLVCSRKIYIHLPKEVQMMRASPGLVVSVAQDIALWSMQMGSNKVPTSTHRIFINLKELSPVQNIKETTLWLTGSVEGSGIILVTTDLGIYQINLNSLQWKKLWRRENYHALFPYMSFYNPREKVSPYDVAH